MKKHKMVNELRKQQKEHKVFKHDSKTKKTSKNKKVKPKKQVFFKEGKIDIKTYLLVELYRRLREEGIEVYPDYKIGNLKCGLVIVKDGKVVLVVEVIKKKRKIVTRDNKQFIEYLDLDLPVLYCLKEKDIEKIIETIKHEYL